MPRSTHRHSNLKFLLCTFTCTTAWDILLILCWVAHAVLSSACKDIIKIPRQNICFYKKHPNYKLLYNVLQYSERALGHSMRLLGSHGKANAKPFLDWALKWSLQLWIRGEGNVLHNSCPPSDRSRAMATLCYDHHHFWRDALLLSQSQDQAHSTVYIS